MENQTEWIELNTDAVKKPEVEGSLFENRSRMYDSLSVVYPYDATIFILCYNHLENTRKCVEYVLQYTQGIDYELILIDNGSSDGTLEYFKSVEHPHKVILHVTKNIGANYPINSVLGMAKGKYVVQLPNDVFVTPRWLTNLLACYESDRGIGLAVPVSTNISNIQQVDLGFSSLEEMQKKADAFNHSDPRKWAQRMRLMPIVTIYRREIIDLVSCYDYGYFYDFADDDYCARIRRAGYKLILCEDTFVHHAHEVWKGEKKDPEEFRRSLQMGRDNYRQKFNGVDGWGDINNFELELLQSMPMPKKDGNRVLGIDVRCGTPVLEIKNKLRRAGKMRTECHAFTSEAKYYLDLTTVMDNTICDRVEFMQEHFIQGSYDYIILGEPINTYARPINLLQQILELVKPGGCLLFKLANVANWKIFLEILGQPQNADEAMPIFISNQNILDCLKMMRVRKVLPKKKKVEFSAASVQALQEIVEPLQASTDSVMQNLCTEFYLYSVEK